jgi:hypothetical protein
LLQWVRTEAIDELASDPSQMHLRGMAVTADGLAALLWQYGTCSVELVHVDPEIASVTARRSVDLPGCDPEDMIFSQPLGLAWDGEALLTLGRCPAHDGVGEGVARLEGESFPGQVQFCLDESATGLEVDPSGERMWLLGQDGSVWSTAYPNGGDSEPSAVSAGGWGPSHHLAADGEALWIARDTFEVGMRNTLAVGRPSAGTIECTFDVEDVRGLTGNSLGGLAVRDRRVFAIRAGSNLLVQLEWTTP